MSAYEERNPGEWHAAVGTCLCSHARSQHSRGKHHCYHAACGCAIYRIKGDPK